jgi:hypothetical protein
MAREQQPLQSGLFDQYEPCVELAHAQKSELATLIEALLLEIATALAAGEVGDDQDHE